MNDGATNMSIKIYFETLLSVLLRIPRGRTAGSYGCSIFSCLRNHHAISHWSHCFMFPPTVPRASSFSTRLPTLVIFSFFDTSHSNGCEVLSHSFDLWLPHD